MNQTPSLLLLHGALGSAVQFEKIKSHLSDTFECETFDFTGHGTAGAGSVFKMEELADQLKTFVEEKQLYSPYIFGYSMGGYAALVLESRHPAILGAVFTLGTKFRWNEEESAKEAKWLNPEKIKQKVPAFAARLALLHGERWEQMLNETAHMMRHLGENPLLGTKLLSQIQIPVCIGRGELDQMVSRDESEQAAESLSRGLYREFPGMEHPIEKVDAAILAAEIRSFFKSSSVSGA